MMTEETTSTVADTVFLIGAMAAIYTLMFILLLYGIYRLSKNEKADKENTAVHPGA